MRSTCAAFSPRRRNAVSRPSLANCTQTAHLPWRRFHSRLYLPADAGVAESVDAPDLDDDLSARGETGDVELLKFGEPCEMAIPSQARRREGVETRRAAPKLRFAGYGEGIVQTTNAHRAAAKVVVGKKIRWALACGGSSPPARTTTSEFTEQGTAQSQSWHQRRSPAKWPWNHGPWWQKESRTDFCHRKPLSNIGATSADADPMNAA